MYSNANSAASSGRALEDGEAQRKIAVWMRVCAAWADAQDMLIVRFGDQMNNVAVTDGDKVEAEQRMVTMWTTAR